LPRSRKRRSFDTDPRASADHAEAALTEREQERDAVRPPAQRGGRGDAVDEASEETFPASDPPAWTPLHAGEPGEHPDHPGDRR
jgi:hypothetical protein